VQSRGALPFFTRSYVASPILLLAPVMNQLRDDIRFSFSAV